MAKTTRSGVISVDMGTSSMRACFIDSSLKIIHSTQIPVNIFTDIGGKAEQDPDEIINAAFECIRRVGKWAQGSDYLPLALCFSNAVSSLVCLDASFQPARPMMTYADVRAYQETEELVNKYDHDFFSHTACPMHASYWLPKLFWLRNHEFPLSKCNYFCTIKDLLIYKLTGYFVTDYSNAVATGMCNVVSGDWDQDLLQLIDLTAEKLPEIRPTTAIIQSKVKNIFTKLNLPEETKVVLGATDGVLSSLGAGAFNPGQVSTMIGSSGACRIAADSPLIDDRETRTWSYPLADDVWIRGGAMNSGGLVTNWFVENFINTNNSDDAFDQMLELAGSIDPGSEGLIFLPYLFGERAPIWNERARGVYFGIHGNHRLAHFVRASIEGILFALYSIFETLVPDLDNEFEIRATGGFVRSPLMLQIQADIFGAPIGIPQNYEGSSVGAAALAFRAIGVFSSFDPVMDLIPIEKTYYPNKIVFKTYNDVFVKFKKIYQQLEPVF